MPKKIQIAFNAVAAKLIKPSQEAIDIVSDLLSYQVEGSEFMSSFGSSPFNGISTFYSSKTDSFPAGFVHIVKGRLSKNGFEVSFVRKPLPEPLGPESPIVDEFGNDNPDYDFQMKALKSVEKHGAGIIRVATGGGKSKIAKLIAARYGRMTLFITTRGVLMYQMKRGFEDFSHRVGIVGDGEWEPIKGINVGMVQTFISQLKRPDLNKMVRQMIVINNKKKLGLSRKQCRERAQAKYDKAVKVRDRAVKLLSMVEVVIGEEAHEAGGNSYFEILKYCKNAHIRVALTATPFMRDSTEDNMRLMAAFGPVLISVSEELLIKRGILATPYFKYEDCNHHPKLHKTSPWQRAYKLGIIEDPYRNAAIVNNADRARKHGLSVLIQTMRTAHGPILVEMLKKSGHRVQFIQGKDSQKVREKALDDLQNGLLDTIVGTNIIDVGVDVPAIGMIINAGGFKAEVGTRQKVGRGLRRKKVVNVAFMVDFLDFKNLTLRGHALSRKQIIENIPGFRENILPKGQDFDWSLFDKT